MATKKFRSTGTSSRALQRKVKIEGIDRYFGEICVPTEKVTEFKAGKKKIVERKLWPGYIAVQMHVNDATWFAIRETSGIGDFTGASGKPSPMQPHEIAMITKQEVEESTESPKLNIKFKVGDKVKVKDGNFESFEGEVGNIDEASGKVSIMISIFGRSTPVELEYWQVETPPTPFLGNRRGSSSGFLVMAKQLVGQAKFQIPGGQATPAPPVGTALGRYGINLGQFVQQFNEKTREAAGMMIPVIVSVYNDRSFEFVMKSPPAAVLLKKAVGLAKGSGVPNKTKVGTVTKAQMEEIAKTKMNDLNARDVEHAVRMIAGTARSMGLVVEG